MVSHSKSSANLTLCFAAMLMACTTQAQLSTLPKRYRSENNGNVVQSNSNTSGSGFGRRTSHQQQKTSSTDAVLRKSNLRRNMRQLEEENSMSMSLPLDVRRFDISMSMPSSIVESDFSMSIDLAAFDDMMSMSMSMPSLTDVPAEKELDSVSLDNGSSTASKLVLASAVAGISALVILAAALFAKSASSRKTEEIRAVDAEEGQLQRVNLSSDLSSEGTN